MGKKIYSVGRSEKNKVESFALHEKFVCIFPFHHSLSATVLIFIILSLSLIFYDATNFYLDYYTIVFTQNDRVMGKMCEINVKINMLSFI